VSLNDWAKLRETIAARAEAAGFPGLLPCALTADCRGRDRAEAISDSGTPLHAPSFVEVVEISEVLRRANVRIASVKKGRYTLACRACTQWFHQREMWRDI
jgi:hypothetical protein